MDPRKTRHRSHGRSAVAPIVSTVLVVAVTLITSVAVSGFIFGSYPSAENTALVQVVEKSVPASVGQGLAFAFCADNSGNSMGGYIQLYNSGVANTTATTLQFVYDGNTTAMVLEGPCVVGSDSSLYVIIFSLPYGVEPGTPYTGYVTTTNGAEVLFAGDFL